MLGWITSAAFLVVLGKIAWTDARTMRIPNRLNAAVFLTGLLAIFTVPGPELAERIAGMFVVSVPMLLAAVFVPGGIGGGDIKLMAAGGLFLGWEGNLLAAVLGLFAGGVFGMLLLLLGKAGRQDAFPFGPCLCGGMMTAFVILCIDGSYHLL